jgi:hypothetical protein
VPVEAPVDEGLDAAAEWRKERGDGKGGGDNGKLGPVLGTGLEHLLQVDDTARFRWVVVRSGTVLARA